MQLKQGTRTAARWRIARKQCKHAECGVEYAAPGIAARECSKGMRAMQLPVAAANGMVAGFRRV